MVAPESSLVQKRTKYRKIFSPPAGNTTISSITFVITKYPFWPAPIQIGFCNLMDIVEGIRPCEKQKITEELRTNTASDRLYNEIAEGIRAL